MHYTVNIPQTAYALQFGKAIPGQVADSELGVYDVSRYVIGGADISAGKGVVSNGSADKRVDLPSGSLARFEGVTHYDASRRPGAYGSLTPAGLSLPEGCAVRRKGGVYVYSETAVSKHGLVYCRHTTNGQLVPGDFRADADLVQSSATADALEDAEFDETTTGAGVVRILLNLAVPA